MGRRELSSPMAGDHAPEPRAIAAHATGRMRDFTTGSIVGHLLAFSLPMFAGNLLQALYNIVDSMWVGRFLGPDALAAVTVSFPILFALVAMVMGLGMATTTMVAQYAGARDTDRVHRTITNSLMLLTLSGLVLTVVGLVVRPHILSLIRTPEQIADLASIYLGVFLIGLVPMFIYNVTGAILRGLGDSRTPLMFLVYATVTNIVLDPLLILGPGPFPALGVAGAALATVIAQTVAAVLAVWYLVVRLKIVNLKALRWRLDRELTLIMLRIGLPSGSQQTFVSLGMLAVSAIVNTFGPVVVAAYGAGLRIDQLAFLPAMTISFAVSSLVGQNLGAGLHDRVRTIVRVSACVSVALSLTAAVVVLTIPGALLGIFTTDKEVIVTGISYLRILAFAFVPFGLMMTMMGVLRGAGDTMAGMLFSIISLWVIRIPLAAYLSSLPELGERGIWLAVAGSTVVGMLLNLGYYLTGRWRRKVLVRPVPRLEGGE